MSGQAEVTSTDLKTHAELPVASVASASSPERSAHLSDPVERLLWTLMAEFERPALERYTTCAPTLATAEKQRFLARLASLGLDERALAASELAAPAKNLLAHAPSEGEVPVLIVQGLVLEHLGQAVYRIARSSSRVSNATRDLAASGLAASLSVTAAATARLAERVGTGDTLYPVFADISHEVIGALDALAEPVDRTFGERFGLRFADVMGEFVADLIGACTALGMQRRKVVAQLACASMGL